MQYFDRFCYIACVLLNLWGKKSYEHVKRSMLLVSMLLMLVVSVSGFVIGSSSHFHILMLFSWMSFICCLQLGFGTTIYPQRPGQLECDVRIALFTFLL